MKKLMSLLVTTSMLSAMAAVPVSAGNVEAYKGDYLVVPQEWEISYIKTNTTWNKKQDYTGISQNEGVDNSSAMVVNIQSPSEANRYIMLSNTLSETLTEGDTYRISFDAKGIDSSYFSTNLSWENITGKSTYTATPNGDFTTYSVDVTAVKDATKLSLVFENKINGVIDNVSLKKVGDESATELVKNGTFDKYEHDYTTVTPYNSPIKRSTSWQVSYNRNSTSPEIDKTKNYMAITDATTHSGKYALLINWEAPQVDNSYVRLNTTRAVHLEKDAEYTISFWAKANNGSQLVTGVVWSLGLHKWMQFGYNYNGYQQECGEDGWVKYTQTAKYTGDTVDTKNFGFCIDYPGSIVVDDISLVKTSEPNKNLIEDPGFENSIYTHEKDGRYTFSEGITIEPGNKISGHENKIYAEPSKDEAHGGNYSLHLVSDSAMNDNYCMKAVYDKELSVGSYTVSFWAKGNEDYGVDPRIGQYGTWNGMISGYTVDQIGDDGWIKYTGNVTIADEYAKKIWIWVDGQGVNARAGNTITDWYFDDFSIVGEDGVDYATDLNGFESVVENPSCSTEINHLMAYPTVNSSNGGGLNVSWSNPKNGIIKDIDVYIDGAAVNNNAYDLTNGAFNEMYVDALTNGQTYNVEVKVTLSDGVVTASTTGTPDNKGSWFSWNGWGVDRKNLTKEVDGKKYPIHSNYNFTTDTGVTGKALKVDINRPSAIGNLYPNVHQRVTAVKGQKHVLKLKYKAENVSQLFVIADYRTQNAEGKNINTWTYLGSGLSATNSSTNGEWVEKTWIFNDGFAVAGVEGTPVKVGGENNSYYYTTDEFDDTASTEIPVDIYIACEEGLGTYWIDDVEFYALDAYNKPKTNQIVNGTFDETYQIYEPEFTNAEGKKLTNLEAGELNVSAKIKNNADSDGINAFVAMGLYKDGVLTALTVGERKVNVSANANPADEFTAQFNVPDLSTGEYKVKVMYWNNEMVPLGGNYELSEAAAQ